MICFSFDLLKSTSGLKYRELPIGRCPWHKRCLSGLFWQPWSYEIGYNFSCRTLFGVHFGALHTEYGCKT